MIDEATQAITEALQRVRSGLVLEERDVAAAGVALGDLIGGLGQLATLLPTSVVTFAKNGPREVGPLEDRLQTLRVMALCAQGPPRLDSARKPSHRRHRDDLALPG